MLVAMTVLAALAGTASGPLIWWAGIAAWLAGLLLWPQLAASQQRQALFISGIGILAYGLSLARGGHPDWLLLLSQNTALLGMLAAVSFLQMLSTSEGEDDTLPRGQSALWRTALGAHLLGAVINLSAVFIIAERIGPNGKPLPQQALILERAFLAAALWSPFFAATATALTYAPGANPLGLAAKGAALASVLICIAVLDIKKSMGNNGADFVGYPMHLDALRTPAMLAILVALGHWLFPHWSALSVISLASLGYVTVISVVGHGPQVAWQSIYQHAQQRLPRMSGELVLFLSAGVFASGLRSLMETGAVWLPFSEFGAIEAAIVLLVMILLSVIGIHTVITIAMAAAWLAPLHPAPDLLALVFVQAWAIGLTVGPMSGINLAIQGRYGIPATILARGNIGYCFKAYVIAVLWLVAVDKIVR
ncbi:conserved membrane protein of unknown function [Georgfuchsia toluolica]|uniref:Uncharacterized protein n=1 Tax=Georgfuchsia toluolica TaxID=424218 RepID=A0A916J4Y3_9PROT|nr:hypothetical protein [Georgfuchsia toluolica]CAG4884027.1 conserved membrane protein of unknown function [Georgfuchsia toluolica]